MTNDQAKQRRVSIIMRTKNSDWVIAQALAGLFSQTHTNFELIIVEDVGERAAAEDLAAFDDPRILHLASEGPGSMASARTRA